MSKLYSDTWRARVRAGAQRSASALVPLLIDRYQPSTVVDVGAGEGWFSKAFAERGVAATTVDGPWIDTDITVDFATPPYPTLGPFDLAVCLEVAEHIDAASGDELVAWLCALAPVVAFSAAIPGQGGTGHVNEQPPGYWADRFEAHGRLGSGALRWAVWDNPDVEPWYAQNLLIFGDDDLPVDGCPFVIHPGIWHVYRR